LDECGEDGVGEDDEGGFAGLGGFGFAPLAESGLKGALGGGVGGGGLLGGGAAGGLGTGFGGAAGCAEGEGTGFSGGFAGRGSRGILDGEIEGLEVAAGQGFAAFVGEGGFFEGDEVAGGVGPLFGGDGDEAGAGEDSEEELERAAAEVGGVGEGSGEEFGVELAGGAGLAFEGAEDGHEAAEVVGIGFADGLGATGDGAGGVAEVAVTAGAGSVGGVSEVADEGGHAALGLLGELGHAVDLGFAEGDLGVVALAPGGGPGSADVALDVDDGGALGGELLGGVVEALGVHPEALAEEVGHLEVFGEDGGYAGELGGWGVVALEEEVVHLAVGEGVQEDGAGGEAVAAGSADLLVVGLDGAGEGDVDDGADVGLVDAHAEGDGGDDDLELAGEEVALDALAGGGVEAGVVGGGVGSEHGG
jgi:hypothetical protein